MSLTEGVTPERTSAAVASTIAARVRRRWRNRPVSTGVVPCDPWGPVVAMWSSDPPVRNPLTRQASLVYTSVVTAQMCSNQRSRDEAFLELWTETSRYFRAQPGFVSLRLHRAVSSDAPHRFVNVAVWESAAHYRAPHQTEEFISLVTQDTWREFPSSPALYEVVVEHDLEPSRG